MTPVHDPWNPPGLGSSNWGTVWPGAEGEFGVTRNRLYWIAYMALFALIVGVAFYVTAQR